ncbi:MAG TPA: hypothetical protein VKC90_10045 [Chitinophagaceae bacterium]|nr:hypothetical protein [Chitinophagaceae bacterium]
MKNCYSDLEKVLQHYGYSFDDVVTENVGLIDETQDQGKTVSAAAEGNKGNETAVRITIGMPKPTQRIRNLLPFILYNLKLRIINVLYKSFCKA